MSAKKKAALTQWDGGEAENAWHGFGAASGNLKFLSRLTGVNIGQRGHELIFGQGEGEKVGVARRVIEALTALAARGESPNEWDTECLANLALDNPGLDLLAYIKPQIDSPLARRKVTARTPGQRAYLAAMNGHDLVFGLGPAGTGKTYLAVAMAVAALGEGAVSRIIITRPAVEAGERLGFLPGDLAEKINPYLRPIYDALDDLIPFDKYVKLTERRVIEVAPLAFMRGRTLGDAFVILDEAQNCTREQMKMFLTRLGPGSKAVVTGDPAQSDLPGGSPSGLAEAVSVLKGVEGIAFCRFSSKDVVRHRLVRKIIEAYEKAEAGTGRDEFADA